MMLTREPARVSPALPLNLPAGAAVSLALLLEAHENSTRLGKDETEFAVELSCLLAAGATPGALRWLLCHGFVEQLVETTTLAARTRSFRPVRNLALGPRSCFVLTADGARLGFEKTVVPRNDKPIWDRGRSELRFGPVVVKRFTQPASSQEAILSAFEEEGWPEQIDDPLCPSPDQDAASRLRSAVNNLNRGRRPSPLRFGVCGRGTAVFWRTTQQDRNEKQMSSK
jgi:hypothetical protein